VDGDTTNELRIAIGRTGATKLQYLAIGKGTRQHALFAGKTGSGKSTLFHVIITNLALACSPEQVEFYLIDFKKGVEFKCYATKHLPHAKVVAIESDREFALSVLQRVDEELKRRGDMFRKLGVQDIAGYKRAGGTEPMPRSLLLIDEFQEFFVEDDTIAQTASLLFDRIVRQGRAFGIHVLLGSQTLGGAYSLARATLGQMVDSRRPPVQRGRRLPHHG
jgi:S-DNA-T family DNA segregation ATPase FtsK/SpoIIIE